MKKFVFITFMIILIFPLKILLFADDTLDKNGYELYNQRVKDICNKYNPEKKIIQTIGYQKAFTPSEKNAEIKMSNNEVNSKNAFSIAKGIYENNMNNIYKCAILNSQITTLKLLQEDILKLSNNPDLSKEIEQELLDKITKIDLSIKKLKCGIISTNNDGIQKLNILGQTTYELCRYHTYLEYLKEYNSKYENLVVLEDNTDYNSMYLVNLEQDRKNQIDNEIAHIYKVYPIAFNAYKEYEDNLSTHILLGLVKDDYKVLRDTLHDVLNPINQVGYKIMNAMQP